MKITSFGGLCEELWERREELFKLLMQRSVIAEGDDGYFRENITCALDAGLIYSKSVGRELGKRLYGWTLSEYPDGDYGDLGMNRYEHDLAWMRENFWRIREMWRNDLHGITPDARLIPDSVLDFFKANELQDKHIRVSEEDPAMWCYTQSEEHALADRQVRMRPGKLLRKVLPPEVKEVVIQAIATGFTQGTAGHPVLFAKTRADIHHVYTHGPDSCMSRKVATFEKCGGVHPTEAYAGPDTAVAYIRDFSDNITARTVTNEVKKLFGRMYGNGVALQASLEALGYAYTDGNPLAGCRLLRIENGSGSSLVCPYLDGGDGIKDDGEYLVIGAGSHESSANGLLNGGSGDDEDDEDGYESHCCNCGDGFDEDGAYIEDHGDVCDPCLEASERYCYAVSDNSRHRSEEWCLSRNCTYVECLETWVHDDVLSGGADYLDIVHSEYHDEYISTACATYIESRSDYVDNERVDLVGTRDGTVELKEDCKHLWDSSWVFDTTDIVTLGRFSREDGSALQEDVRPALGEPEDSMNYVLVDEVVDYLGLEFYDRDCVIGVSGAARRWMLPRIAAVGDDSDGWIEAQLSLPFHDEHKSEVKPEVEVEEEVA